MSTDLNTLPYCDTALGPNATSTYQVTASMPAPWDKLSCIRWATSIWFGWGGGL